LPIGIDGGTVDDIGIDDDDVDWDAAFAPIRVNVDKNRNGQRGKTVLAFHGPTQRFVSPRLVKYKDGIPLGAWALDKNFVIDDVLF